MRPGKKNKILSLCKDYSVKSNFCYVLFFLVLVACGKKDKGGGPGLPAAPAASTSVDPEELQRYIESRIEAEDLKNFAQRFDDICSRYYVIDEALQRKTIAAFAVSIASAESRLNSFDEFYEKTMGYYSSGLFSISYKDRKTYDCELSAEDDKGLPREEKKIYQTENQVNCFFQISRKILGESQKFSYLKKISQDDKQAKGNPRLLTVKQKMSAYWSVLRPSNEDGQARFEKMLRRLLPGECQT